MKHVHTCDKDQQRFSDPDYAMLHMQIGNLSLLWCIGSCSNGLLNMSSPLHACTTFERVCDGREELVVSAGKQQHLSSYSTHTSSTAYQLSPRPASIITVASPSHNKLSGRWSGVRQTTHAYTHIHTHTHTHTLEHTRARTYTHTCTHTHPHTHTHTRVRAHTHTHTSSLDDIINTGTHASAPYKKASMVFFFQALGLHHHPPAGDHTYRG